MKNKTLKIILVILYLILITIFIKNYHDYLKKPTYSTWDKTKDYLTSSGYDDEPIFFEPSWLKNYATDFGRFKDFNLEYSKEKPMAYWLITINNKFISNDSKVIDNLIITKINNE